MVIMMFLAQRAHGQVIRRCLTNRMPSQPSSSNASRSRSSGGGDGDGVVTLQFLHDDSVAVVTLQNPQRRNALSVSMMEQLDTHVQSLLQWSTNKTTANNARAVILTGSAGTFCSGLDLNDYSNDAATIIATPPSISANDATSTSGDNSSTAHLLRDGKNMLYHMTRVTNQLLSLPVLSISAIDGYAMGGGAELTTCTDLVVLSTNAKIQFVHAKRGASPGWGGLRRLVNKVGRERALRMLLLGECILGEDEAKRSTAYADVVANEGESALHATMRVIINPLVELPCSQSIRAMKRAVSYADGDGEVMMGNTIDERFKFDTNMAMRGERDAFLSVWGGKTNVEQIQKAKDRIQRSLGSTPSIDARR
jgi:ethylmalonyl-CoA/methylmalonyl-CoA decarboxylase